MNRILMVALGLAVLPACIFVDHDDRHDDGDWTPPPADLNHAPYIESAASGCYYDEYNLDDIWWFDAVVDDTDGALDVVSVWADVYDEASGVLVESFELYPTDDPYYWYSDWLVSSTYLDCWYPLYTIDITAYDTYDAFDIATVYPDTYR